MESLDTVNFSVGLLLISGLIFGLAASRLGMPRVVGYVVAGMFFSPDLLGRISGFETGAWTSPVTTAALGIIAYLIGGSITVEQLRRTGRIIMGSALGESLGAVITVFIVLTVLLSHTDNIQSVKIALPLAAVAATTAPAGTIATLHQYRAKGPLANTMLGVVAIDDALGIIYFSLMIVFTTGHSITSAFGTAIYEICGSVAAGAFTGGLLSWLIRKVGQRELRIVLVTGTIMLIVGIAELMELSPLLASMSMGFVSRYSQKAAGDRLFEPVEYLEELVFIIFFTVAGTHFDVSVFYTNFSIIIGYFFARCMGKIVGAYIGAGLGRAPENVRYWLGFGLVPQAGVAVGLILSVSQRPEFSDAGTMLVNVVLATTVIYELLGPVAVKLALKQAGELGEKRERRRT